MVYAFIGDKPRPLTKSGRPRKSKYPFHSTKPGGHFTVPYERGISSTVLKSRVNSLAYVHLGAGNYRVQLTPLGVKVYRMR